MSLCLSFLISKMGVTMPTSRGVEIITWENASEVPRSSLACGRPPFCLTRMDLQGRGPILGPASPGSLLGLERDAFLGGQTEFPR